MLTTALVAAGPLADQPDSSLRGIQLFRAACVEEAWDLAEGDLAVKGRAMVDGAFEPRST